MVSHKEERPRRGRPPGLAGPAKVTVREAFAIWVQQQADQYEVSHMTIRRALENRRKKKTPGSSTEAPGS